MATEAKEKSLRRVSFIIHATRGIIRDQKARRRTMLGLVAIALVLIVAGSTFLQSSLNPREHPLGFLVFWIICGWVTFSALLLAIFDLVMVRLEVHRSQRALREDLKNNSPGSTTDE